MPDFAFPSFKGKDLDDAFYFVGRLKEQVLESKDFERNDGSGSFTVMSLRVVHERLDAETISPRYSFFKVPENRVTPRSPLGQYITAMETADTPISFEGGQSLETLQEALSEQIGTIYVLIQKSIEDRKGKEPGRYCFPIARIGFGQDWDPDEAKRIISEARSVSASGVVKATKAAVPQAATLMETPTQAELPLNEQPTAELITDWKAELAQHLYLTPVTEAQRTAISWVTLNRTRIDNGIQALAEATRASFIADLIEAGYVYTDENTLLQPASR